MSQTKQSPALEPGFTKAHEGTGALPFYRTKPPAGTQCAEVLDLLLAGRALTHLDALREVGTSRLAAHVHVLRRMGWPIDSRSVPVECRKGRGAHVSLYSLPEGLVAAHAKPEGGFSNGG